MLNQVAKLRRGEFDDNLLPSIINKYSSIAPWRAIRHAPTSLSMPSSMSRSGAM